MTYLEKKMEILTAYLPELTKKDDFDEFWENTLSMAKKVDLNIQVNEIKYPGGLCKEFNLTYTGWNGQRIHGIFAVPSFLKQEKYPCVVNYHGYMGKGGDAASHSTWLSMGLCVLAIDVRGQRGLTGDDTIYEPPFGTSLITKGLRDKNTYYLRSQYMDAFLAISCAEQLSFVDSKKIIISGGSQGGAITMAMAALDDRVIAAVADVPSNSEINKRVEGAFGSYKEVNEYLQHHPEDIDAAFDTLSYFDTMNMADKITCPVSASVGLSDTTCPPECYFATFNKIQSEKEITLYPYSGHGGGGVTQKRKNMFFVERILNNIK